MTELTDEQPSPLEAARDAVAPVLDLLGILRVISIDDQNVLNQGAAVYDPDAVVARLQSGSLPLADLVGDAVLQDLFSDEDGDTVDLDEAVDRVRAGVPEDAQARLTELSVFAETADDTPGQIDPADVTDVGSRPALEVIFGGHNYKAATLAEWRDSGDTMLADGTPTLLLIDRDFSREGGAIDAGDQLVAQMLARPEQSRPWCCLLTHSAQNEDEEARLEQEISTAANIDDNLLVVLSKPQLDANPTRFAARLLGVLLKSHLITLRKMLNAALDVAHDAATQTLAKISDFQLLSMFAAAIREGLHEPDHILRPLRAVARRAMISAVRPDGATKETLGPLHTALALEPPPAGIRPDDTSSVEILEQFDSGHYLAETVQPIEPGDIFQIVDPDEVLRGEAPDSKHHLILLAQPCDVMVRGTGKRGANVPSHWALARLRSYRPGKNDLDDPQRRENVLLTTFLDGKPRLIKLAEVVHVPVLALDLCAFDPHGYSRLTVGDAAPTKASWSWTKRHDLLSEAVGKIIDDAIAADLQNLPSGSADLIARALTGCLTAPGMAGDKLTVKVAIDLPKRRIAFGLRRVGRLNDAATRSLLVQATHHQGRPADEAALVADLSSKTS